MPHLTSGGAEKSFISLLHTLPEGEFDYDVMIVNEGGLFYNSVPKRYNRIEAPLNLRIALESVHSAFIKRSPVIVKLKKFISNFLLHTIGRISSKSNLQFTWTMWRRCIPALETKYDIAVSFMNGITNYYVIDKVQARRKLLWMHNDYSKNSLRSDKSFAHRYASKADKVVTISDACVKSLQDAFPDLKEKFICLENISSPKMIESMAAESYPDEYKDTDKDTCKILSIGRLTEQKGFDLAIYSAAILKERCFKFRWFIIGIGALETQLQQMIYDNGLQSEIILLGERSNPYPYIKHCELFLQTSRYEGKSIVVDEAKILNKTIIVTRYPSVIDNIQDGVSGVICDMNPENIAEAIIGTSNNHEQQQAIAKYLNCNCNGNETEITQYIKIFKGYVQ